MTMDVLNLIIGFMSVALGLVGIGYAIRISKKSDILLKGVADLLFIDVLEITRTKLDEELTNADKEKIELAYNRIFKPTTDKEFFTKGVYWWRITKEENEAIDSFEQAIRLNSEFSEAYFQLGKVHLYKESPDYDKALGYLTKAIELVPDYSDAHNYLGVVYESREDKDYGKAIKCYENAIRFNPRSAIAYNSLGIAYAMMDEKDYTKAIACYEKAIELKPDYADAYYDLGFDLSDYEKNPNPNYTKAIWAFGKAIEFNPKYQKAYYEMGKTYQYGLNDFQKAIVCYRNFLDCNDNESYRKAYLKEEMPNLPKVYYALGCAYFAIGDMDNAKCYMQNAAEKGYNPANEWLINNQ